MTPASSPRAIGSATQLCRFAGHSVASLARTRAMSTYRPASLCLTTSKSRTTTITTTPFRMHRYLPGHDTPGTVHSSTSTHHADPCAAVAAAGEVSSVLEQDPTVHSSFDKVTGSWQYVVADAATCTAAIIDPVLDFDPLTGKISTDSADALMRVVNDNGYKIDLILETHAHADHMTAASYLQHRLSREHGHRARICIGSRITQVQEMFGERYNIPAHEYEGSFDKLWQDNETFNIGNLTAKAIHLPGHTPDHLGYKIGGNVFVGDSVFNVDLGSARTDFPGGSAEAIFDSGRRLFSLPDDTKIWIGHDYPPKGRDEPVAFMTVKQQKEANKHLRNGTAKQQFMEMRRSRDSTLASPKLLHQSLQINIRAGRLPKPTAAGERMLQMPLETDVAW